MIVMMKIDIQLILGRIKIPLVNNKNRNHAYDDICDNDVGDIEPFHL